MVLQTTWLYSIVVFYFSFLFTYFYTAVTFDPESVATNLQKKWRVRSGIRQEHQQNTSGRLSNQSNIDWRSILGIIAVLPVIMRQITGISSLAIGGTALLIVVSVIIDILKESRWSESQ